MNRRNFLKTSVCVAASSVLASSTLTKTAVAGQVSKDRSKNNSAGIRMAGYPYEHVLGLMNGDVKVKDRTISFETGKIGDLNTHVFSGPGTLDVTEIGLSPYMIAFANEGFRDYSLIPVFPLRLFRHKSIFVNTDSGISKPADLKGKRIGTPSYSSTSLTWIRGMLQDEYNIRPEDVEWVVSAKDSSASAAGSISKQESVFPEYLKKSIGPEGKDESDLLINGDVDALFHAVEPRAFIEGHPKIKRLFIDPRTVEREYYAKTGIFPIMHAVAVRKDLIQKHPWLPEAVFNAYSEAKQHAYDDMRKKWFLRTLPWFAQELKATEDLMGDNFFPYGIEANRKSLEALFRYSYEQGLASRILKIEEVFEPSTMKLTES